jgi:phenylalanyl-tRNA synthetase beta chain
VKITYHWLQEFTEVSGSAAELAKELTMTGLEVESVTPVAPPFSGVVVGEVLKSTRHGEADKLSVCEVTSDGNNRLQIICGAKNVRAGIKVAVAMVGAQLPGAVTIKRATLRGLESNGMLCSARELGLGENHDGIMELPDSLPLSQNLRDALDLDDSMLEVKATPNRGDCMSVFGIARDYTAAQQRRYLKYESVPVAARHEAVFPVSLDSPGCPIFASRVIRGVRPGAQSPEWLRERLRRVGIYSISAIVDVTNFVMMELGQPMHAYDLAKLKAGISVRLARADERIMLLDDKEHELDPEFLVIADASGAIGLAGIMGGRATAISASTIDVLLEAAHFTPVAIEGRARRLGLFTDAAQRFERGVDPSLPAIAMERATALLTMCAGGDPGPTQVARAAESAAPEHHWVRLRRARVARLLGAAVPDGDVQSVLGAISDRVEGTADGWRVHKPPHRFDLRIEADLIEEVARLRGFDSIAESHAIAPQIPGAATESKVSNDRLLTAMADCGYREIITYSFVDPNLQQQLFPNVPSYRLANPIAADLSDMRVSLWTGLVQTCRENLRRQQHRVRLFEIGNKFQLQASGNGGELREVETLAGIATGSRWPEQWGSRTTPVDFYDVKADLFEVLKLTGDTSDVVFAPDSLPVLRPGRAARIYRGAVAVGWLGEIHPQIAKALGLPEAFLFELEITPAFSCKPIQFKGISRFPSVRRDLAIVVDESLPLAVLQENVTVSASGLLSELRVFDVYRGPGIETGRKSIALGLILQDSSRTLTDVDADAVIAKVVARLRDELSATIRDQ